MPRNFTTHILKSKGYNASNNGVSARHDEVIVVPEGQSTDAPNAVRIVKRHMGGRVLFHAEPINDPRAATEVGPMMGGSFISLTGYTFNLPEHPELEQFYGAIALHDRFESVALYRSMSD